MYRFYAGYNQSMQRYIYKELRFFSLQQTPLTITTEHELFPFGCKGPSIQIFIRRLYNLIWNILNVDGCFYCRFRGFRAIINLGNFFLFCVLVANAIIAREPLPSPSAIVAILTRSSMEQSQKQTRIICQLLFYFPDHGYQLSFGDDALRIDQSEMSFG